MGCTLSSDDQSNLDLRVSYLKDCYGFYIQHINSMFNFFLVATGLFANAYVLLLSKDYGIADGAKSAMCWFAALVCLIFLLIHLGTRRDLDAVESALRHHEKTLFAGSQGFLTAGKRKPILMRLKYLFPAAYLSFFLAFTLVALWQNPPSIPESMPFKGLGWFTGPLTLGEAASCAGLASTAWGAAVAQWRPLNGLRFILVGTLLQFGPTVEKIVAAASAST